MGQVSTVRCKMRVSKVTHQKEADGTTSYENVELQAVYNNSPENAIWSKYTPSANFTITISNPDAMNKLSSGHEYFVDFHPAQ